MSKSVFIIVIAVMNIVCFHIDGFGAIQGTKNQPVFNEKMLEQSLHVFSKKIIDRNKVSNIQFKRYRKQAVLSFDIVKPTEIMLMLYMLEYTNGNWRISKEYHYTRTTIANVC